MAVQFAALLKRNFLYATFSGNFLSSFYFELLWVEIAVRPYTKSLMIKSKHSAVLYRTAAQKILKAGRKPLVLEKFIWNVGDVCRVILVKQIWITNIFGWNFQCFFIFLKFLLLHYLFPWFSRKVSAIENHYLLYFFEMTNIIYVSIEALNLVDQ